MASAKPDARRHAFAGAGASVLASTPTSSGSSLQPSPMSSSRSNPTSRTQPPHPAFGGKPGASTPPLPRSASLAQKAMRADEDNTRRNLRFVLTSADLVTIEELGENQFVLAITRPELPLPRGSPQLKRQQTIEQTMHQLIGGGGAPALPQSNTSSPPSSKPAAHRVLSSPLFGNKGAAGSPSSSSASAAKAHAPSRHVMEQPADAQQQRDASRAAENERLRRRAEYSEKQKELRAAAAAAAPPPKPKPVTAAAARSAAGAATKASPASLSGSRAKAASSPLPPPPEPSPVHASPPPPIQPPPPPRPAWQRYVDEASGMPYWHHEASGTSTWTDPTAPMPMALAAGPAREECAIS